MNYATNNIINYKRRTAINTRNNIEGCAIFVGRNDVGKVIYRITEFLERKNFDLKELFQPGFKI